MGMLRNEIAPEINRLIPISGNFVILLLYIPVHIWFEMTSTRTSESRSEVVGTGMMCSSLCRLICSCIKSILKNEKLYCSIFHIVKTRYHINRSKDLKYKDFSRKCFFPCFFFSDSSSSFNQDNLEKNQYWAQ